MGGGGGGFHGGGFSAPSFHGGGFSAPSFHGGGMSGMRMSPSLSSGMGSLRMSPSLSSGLRSSPSISGFRGPSLNSGPSLSRIPSLNNGLGGLNSALRPSLGSNGNLHVQPFSSSATRGSLGSQAQSGLRLGNGTLSGQSRTGLGTQSALGLGNGNITSQNRAGLGTSSSLRLGNGNNPAGANLNSATRANIGAHLGTNAGNSGIIAKSGTQANGTGALHLPFAGRVTPGHVGNFLSLSNRGGVNAGGLNAGGGLRGTQLVNASHSINHGNWNHLPNSQITHINNNLNGAFHHHGGFGTGHIHNGFGYGFGSPYWNNWAGGVRGYCNFNRFYGCFSPRFWATNYCYYPWRRSYYWWGGYQPWSYWWGCPTWGSLGSWFPNYGWSSPYYYGYGPGGNIVLNNGYVYMNDQPIATVTDYAASAAALADVPTPANPDQATEWLPLGTFALSEGENDKDPSRVVQLAVDKDGIVSGTMTNQKTKQTYPIQGRVDKETQRVAFTIGNNKDVVLETGIYNLTQQQTPVLAHGEGREETYLLLRLDPPKTDDAKAAAPATPPPPAPDRTLVP
jgi:hypothetical protein